MPLNNTWAQKMKPNKPVYFLLLWIIIMATNHKPWKQETSKMARNVPTTTYIQAWPFESAEAKFCFREGMVDSSKKCGHWLSSIVYCWRWSKYPDKTYLPRTPQVLNFDTCENIWRKIKTISLHWKILTSY